MRSRLPKVLNPPGRPPVSRDERAYGHWRDVAGERALVGANDVQNVAWAGLLDAGACPEDADFLIDVYPSKALQGDYVLLRYSMWHLVTLDG